MSDSGAQRRKLILLVTLLVVCGLVLSWWPFGRGKESADQPSRRWEVRWFSRFKQQQHEAANRSSRLVFLGDSITQNWEDLGQATWNEYYVDRQALNLGISSDKTQHVLWRVLNMQFGEQPPELIVLLVGTNNSAADSPEEIADGVGAIIEALQRQTPQSKVLLLAIFPRGETLDDPRRAVNEATNQLLARFADGERVVFLDINDEFLLDGGATDLSLLPDALHPNSAGYAAWAAAMEPTISALMADGRPDRDQQ